MDGPSIIFKYFPECSDLQKKQISELAHLYEAWNAKINLISRKDIDHLYLRHVLHSLSVAKIIRFKDGSRILDVGTGGGFPGIPLAIMFPGSHFHLIDSIGKKIRVVQAIVDHLKLKNVTTDQTRVENDTTAGYDFVLSRAVTDLETFYKWVGQRISKNSFNSIRNGILYLKGGDIETEMKGLNTPYEVFELTDYINEPFFVSKKLIYIIPD